MEGDPSNHNAQNNKGIVSHTIEVEEVDIRIGLNVNDDEWEAGLREEQEAWDALESVQRTESGGIKITAFITFSEALQQFQSEGVDRDNIQPTVPRSGIAAVLHFMFGPPKLHPSLVEERDLVFTIATKPLQSNEVHHRVLQTVYKRLTGAKMDCPRIGGHWDVIGFQGTDPATDLRGTGFLSLMHILHGVTDHNVSGIYADIYKLSTDEEHNFPFAVMSINITRITLAVLRAEKLNRECNRRKQVIAVVNEFYMALFWHVYHIWKSQFKTMKDSGYVMKDCENEAIKNPKKILRNFDKILKERRAKSKESSANLFGVGSVQRTVSAASSVSTEHSINRENSPRLNEQSITLDVKDTKDSDINFADIREVEDVSDQL